ncbi:hypothetical protein M4R22_10865 [Acidovorax sp. GBBC 3334]|uniref:hypothetical protein n=1 Tax=Acidovorax sp. GBBC 3334 TaxID=2940496 RepID=UPI002303BCD9|nr:hypothetical protein [Acidovorax sp. GBBC 3334]MDA8455262.1 hypothetical protein [Acidovorax sp. GBBC 3334]
MSDFDPVTHAELLRVAASVATLQSSVGALGAVKSVQRGVVTPAETGGIAVTIASVNPSKAFVLASLTNSFGQGNSWNAPQIGAMLLSATELRVIGAVSPISGGGSYYVPVSWQVVEFY